MEHSQNKRDCYFFMYSTCKKGELCPFRHEPSALGCETMCSDWQQGNCHNERCSFKHMELNKNRKLIPCYWETQPSGCRKTHCSFFHKNVRAIHNPINPVIATDITTKHINQDCVNRPDETESVRNRRKTGNTIAKPAIAPLIIKLGEDSDNESIPSPVKTQPKQRMNYRNTYDMIRLEKIQAEISAYYNYDEQIQYRYRKVAYNKTKINKRIVPTRDIGRKTRADITIVGTVKIKNVQYNNVEEDESMMPQKKRMKPNNNDKKKDNITDELNFGILSLEEIRRRKKLKTMEKDVKLLENVKSNLSKLFDEKTSSTAPTNDLSANSTKTNNLTSNILRTSNVTLTSVNNQGVKGVLGTDKGTTESDENKRRVKAKLNITNNTESLTKVPPLRLRRSAKRNLNNIATNKYIIFKEQQESNIPTTIPTIINDNYLLLTSDQTSVLIDNKKMNEIGADNERIKQNLTSSLNFDSNFDVRLNMRDDSNNKTKEVQVPLCDSSMNEKRMIIEDELKAYNNYGKNEQAKSMLIDTTMKDSKDSKFFYDSLQNINEDELSNIIDISSDDIIKEIDALLTDYE